MLDLITNSFGEVEMSVDILFLSTAKAAAYLGCSVKELEVWIKPDRIALVGRRRLWSTASLDAAKPRIDEWRERARVISEQRQQEREAARLSPAARRRGMRKGRAYLVSQVRSALGCSLTELNRWAADGRLPPDGEIVMRSFHTAARAWLPATIDAAKEQVPVWREQDRVAAVQR